MLASRGVSRDEGIGALHIPGELQKVISRSELSLVERARAGMDRRLCEALYASGTREIPQFDGSTRDNV
jgi:hypothetical protein